jgi:hypothetical protein
LGQGGGEALRTLSLRREAVRAKDEGESAE